MNTNNVHLSMNIIKLLISRKLGMFSFILTNISGIYSLKHYLYFLIIFLTHSEIIILFSLCEKTVGAIHKTNLKYRQCCW